MIKTNSLTKAKRGSVGSLTSLNEKSDSLEIDEVSTKKSLHASKSLEMDLDEISKNGEKMMICLRSFTNSSALVETSYQKKSLHNGGSSAVHDYKGTLSSNLNLFLNFLFQQTMSTRSAS